MLEVESLPFDVALRGCRLRSAEGRDPRDAGNAAATPRAIGEGVPGCIGGELNRPIAMTMPRGLPNAALARERGVVELRIDAPLQPA